MGLKPTPHFEGDELEQSRWFDKLQVIALANGQIGLHMQIRPEMSPHSPASVQGSILSTPSRTGWSGTEWSRQPDALSPDLSPRSPFTRTPMPVSAQRGLPRHDRPGSTQGVHALAETSCGRTERESATVEVRTIRNSSTGVFCVRAWTCLCADE